MVNGSWKEPEDVAHMIRARQLPNSPQNQVVSHLVVLQYISYLTIHTVPDDGHVDLIWSREKSATSNTPLWIVRSTTAYWTCLASFPWTACSADSPPLRTWMRPFRFCPSPWFSISWLLISGIHMPRHGHCLNMSRIGLPVKLDVYQSAEFTLLGFGPANARN